MNNWDIGRKLIVPIRRIPFQRNPSDWKGMPFRPKGFLGKGILWIGMISGLSFKTKL
jgi:hypothetical protein